MRACVGRNQMPNTTDYSVIPCCRSTGCGATQSIRQGPWIRWEAEGLTSPALSAPGLPILSVRTHQTHSYGLLIGSVVRATAYQWLANHSELTLVLHRGWAVVVSKPAGQCEGKSRLSITGCELRHLLGKSYQLGNSVGELCQLMPFGLMICI